MSFSRVICEVIAQNGGMLFWRPRNCVSKEAISHVRCWQRVGVVTFCRWNPKKVGFHLSFDILMWQLVQICIHQTITAGGEVFYTYLIFWRDSREKGVYGKVGKWAGEKSCLFHQTFNTKFCFAFVYCLF